MKKFLSAILIVFMAFAFVPSEAFAGSNATHGEITGKSAIAGVTSLLIWPGIGQYLNDQPTEKNIVHALLGLTVIFRFWSGWDALIQRDGGYWEGRI